MKAARTPGGFFYADLCRYQRAYCALGHFYLTHMTQDQIKDLKGRAEALRRYL